MFIAQNPRDLFDILKHGCSYHPRSTATMHFRPLEWGITRCFPVPRVRLQGDDEECKQFDYNPVVH